MKLPPRGWRSWVALVVSATALPVACYDTPVIPDPGFISLAGKSGSDARGGTANTPSENAGEGGTSDFTDAGSAPDTAGKTTGGKTSSGGTTGGGSTGGAKTGGNGSGGHNTGGTSSGGAGQAGDSSLPRVTWLDLSGSQAPSTSTVNAELGIEGWFYAYADSCATLTWNETTRCASGQTCDPHVNGDAWGVAIGFDFRNTGESGSPPNTKLLWNPNDVGALGVTWQVHGPAPSLQLWVLNMASTWNGRCDVMTCEIAGPPDGVDAAAPQGELLFAGMKKDDWNGSGVPYTYDPAAVHALQFKLPAIRFGAADFDFCIDALGIVK